jgi:lipoyl-dependent peroxiredoxin subunit D
MGIDTVKEALPDYARDVGLNLGGLRTISTLSEQQLWGAVVAATAVSPLSEATAELMAEARTRLPEGTIEAAEAAAAIMAMNNVYYRSKDLLAQGGVSGYEDLPARLRMQVIAERRGAPQDDFELWCLVASAVNGCAGCLAAHERQLKAAGWTSEQVHDGLRIAAIVHAACATLAFEQSLVAT